MVLEVINDKGKSILFGRKISEKELQYQLKFIEDVTVPEQDDFPETLARMFDWNILKYDEKPDYIYNRITKKIEFIKS